MRHHRHLHERQDLKGGWDQFVGDVEDKANDVKNFFQDDKPTPAVVAKAAEPSTVYHTVYKTMSKTFEGEIAGWSTVGAAAAPETEVNQPKVQPTPPPQAKSPDNDDNDGGKNDDDTFTVAANENTEKPGPKATDGPQILATAESQINTAKPTQTLESLPESLVPTNTKGLGDHTTLAVATDNREIPTQATTPTADGSDATAILGATSSATASSDANADSDAATTSAGAKAGIAFGVLGGILVVGLLVWFLFNKRKSQMEKNQRVEDDEKINGAFGGQPQMQERPERPASVQTARTDATAPQLSLRPVTQFNPTFGERRSSRGAAMALNIAAANQGGTERGPPTSNSLWERPATGNSNHQDNPFRDNAGNVSPANQPNNPFDAPENVVGMATSTPPQSSPVGTAMTSDNGPAVGVAAATAGAAAAAGLVRKTSIRKDAPAPLDLTLPHPMSPVPPSPAGTEFSQSEMSPGQSPGPSDGAAAIAAAGGPAQTLVHRVQLDFKPTLEDEMELKSGMLVRLLHEYDDGWVSFPYELTICM